MSTAIRPAGALEYPYDWRRSWGPATFHVPHVNSTAFVYQVPFGRGQRFGSGANRALNTVLGGWQLSGIISIRSGQVYHVVSGRDSANTGHTLAATVERADIVSPAVPAGFQQNQGSLVRSRRFPHTDIRDTGECVAGFAARTRAAKRGHRHGQRLRHHANQSRSSFARSSSISSITRTSPIRSRHFRVR